MGGHHGNSIGIWFDELLGFINGIGCVLEGAGNQVQLSFMIQDISRCIKASVPDPQYANNLAYWGCQAPLDSEFTKSAKELV